MYQIKPDTIYKNPVVTLCEQLIPVERFFVNVERNGSEYADVPTKIDAFSRPTYIPMVWRERFVVNATLLVCPLPISCLPTGMRVDESEPRGRFYNCPLFFSLYQNDRRNKHKQKMPLELEDLLDNKGCIQSGVTYGYKISTILKVVSIIELFLALFSSPSTIVRVASHHQTASLPFSVLHSLITSPGKHN